MGDHDTPGQRAPDGLLAASEHGAHPAAPQHQVGDLVTFVSYPELLGREGIIVHINTRNAFPYTVELAGGDLVTCREDDLAPAA